MTIDLSTLSPEELYLIHKEINTMVILTPWVREVFTSGTAMARYDATGRQRVSVHNKPFPPRHSGTEPLQGKCEVLIATPEPGCAFHGLLVRDYQFIGLADTLEEGKDLADEMLTGFGYLLCKEDVLSAWQKRWEAL